MKTSSGVLLPAIQSDGTLARSSAGFHAVNSRLVPQKGALVGLEATCLLDHSMTQCYYDVT